MDRVRMCGWGDVLARCGGGIIYLGRYVCTVSDVEKDRED